MATTTIARITFNNVIMPTKLRDFGNKKGYGIEFSIIIDDPNLQKQLIDDGVSLYFSPNTNKDEPPKAYLNCKLDNRYNDVVVAVDRGDGNLVEVSQNNLVSLDEAWIKDADVHCVLSSWSRNNRSGVSVYAKTVIIRLLTEEEKNEIKQNYTYTDPLREKYSLKR
jgi:hypothetical protein